MPESNWWRTWNYPPRKLAWVQVLIAIIGNIIGGSLLSKSDGFSHVGYAIGSSVSYLVAFYFLAVAMRTLPVSTSYPLQIAGVVMGTVLVGLLLFGEEANIAKILAIVAIIIGAAILESKPELRPELEEKMQITGAPADRVTPVPETNP